MKILVLGSNGQVGSHLRECLPEAVFWTRNELDLAKTEQIGARIATLAPEVIVNCAAYTAVDAAEKNPALAWQINANAPACLAVAANASGARLIHLSTDYVFDGESDHAYAPTDPVCPINTYGRTKLAGELAVSSIAESYWVLRTSWVFSEYSQNFLKTILRLASERDTLRVVADQVGVPTDAKHIALAIRALIARSKAETLANCTYHLTGGRRVTWYEFASAIVEEAKQQDIFSSSAPNVTAIATHEYTTLARRPKWSVLRPSDDVIAQSGIRFEWHTGVRRSVAKLRDHA